MWYKGNLHSHSTESDGDESPEKVAEWFRDHGYDWLCLSDHNVLTTITPQSGKPLMIRGEELTVRLKGQEKPVYVTTVGISTAVEPIDAGETLSTIQANVDVALDAGGIAILSAPYYRSGFDPLTLREIESARLMDVFNAHPAISEGDPRKSNFEEIWDEILSSGKTVFGTATDDCHNYREFGADKANPGGAWVVVRAPNLSEEAVIQSLTSGDFYASTGVILNDLEKSEQSVSLQIEQNTIQSYKTTFIGREGAILAEESGLEVSYRIRGDEGYVRATVTSSWGAKAWVQPVFTT